MKKVYSLALIVLAAALLMSACTKEKQPAATASAPAKYTSETVQSVKVSDIEIKVKKYTFTIGDKEFYFSSFKKGVKKISTSYGDKDLDIYAENNKLTKCELSSKDSVGNHIYTTTYSAEGKGVSYCKNEFDEYGNKILSTVYDSEGNLKNIYQNKYDKKGNIVLSYKFNSAKALVSFTEYKYDEKNKLTAKNTYDKNSNPIG